LWPFELRASFGQRSRSSRRSGSYPALGTLYCYSKGIPRISAKNQITIPVSALEEAGLRAGDQVAIEPLREGELRVRRGAPRFDEAFGVLTGVYPPGYLAQLDAEDEQR
jgi:bifunctional DNA-binding transcriptional regulator/antitoxin component of YhaV-PrlF toxin-antitoxin module